MSKVVEKTVYLIRHGQSEGNVSPVFQSLDSRLTHVGVFQAMQVANKISKISFDVLLTSPLLRARQTAEVIARAIEKLPEFSDLFVERIKPTRLFGKKTEDAEAGRLWKEWVHSLCTPNVKTEDGENFDEIVVRADRALEFFVNRPETSFVVVSHGFFIRTMVARVSLGEAFTPEAFKSFQSSISTKNTGVTILRYGKDDVASWCLSTYNDHSHLPQ